jgi:rhomboid protease GluP
MFIRNENFRSFLRLYPIISIIIALHIVVFIALNFFPNRYGLLTLGVGSNTLIGQGEYWRLLTPIFMHKQFGHFLFNSFSLILFGPALERILGKGKFIAGYLGAGVLANIGTYFLGGTSFPPHLGASGAIFGLFGIYLYMVLNRKELIDRMNTQIITTILVLSLIMTFFTPNINILGHLFGLVGGAALAPILLANVRSRSW